MNDPTSDACGAAEALITSLERAGFTVRLDAGQLRVSPGSKLSAEQKAAITQHVQAMTYLLSTWPSKECQEAMDAEPRWPEWSEGQHVQARMTAVVNLFGRLVCVDAEEHRLALQAFGIKGSVSIR